MSPVFRVLLTVLFGRTFTRAKVALYGLFVAGVVGVAAFRIRLNWEMGEVGFEWPGAGSVEVIVAAITLVFLVVLNFVHALAERATNRDLMKLVENEQLSGETRRMAAEAIIAAKRQRHLRRPPEPPWWDN